MPHASQAAKSGSVERVDAMMVHRDGQLQQLRGASTEFCHKCPQELCNAPKIKTRNHETCLYSTWHARPWQAMFVELVGPIGGKVQPKLT